MAEKPLRFAVVGLGMGQHHCLSVSQAEGAELVVACDLVPERVKSMVDKYGCAGSDSFDAILADRTIDVVCVATPSGVHADMAIAAMRAGKHVVTEKPPDVSVAKVDAMIAVQRETGKKVEVIFQSRFEPVYRRIRQTIAEGRLGRLSGVHGALNWFRAQSYFASPGNWKGTWALDGGGSLSNQGVHTVDLLQWMCGPVAEVYGKFGVYAHEIESEDKTAAMLTFANGALGTLTTTTAAWPGFSTEIFIHGEHGAVALSDGLLKSWRVRGESAEAEAAEEREMLDIYGPQEAKEGTLANDPFALSARGHLAQIQDIMRAIREDGETEINPQNTRHTVQIFTAIYESGRTGRPVTIS